MCGVVHVQMLVYEYMPNGNVRDWLSGNFYSSKSFLYTFKQCSKNRFRRSLDGKLDLNKTIFRLNLN